MTEQSRGVSARKNAIPRMEASGPGVLSFNERRQWFLERLVPNSTAYTISLATTFTGHLDVAAFRRALQAVVDRQEVLRTRFVETDGEPFRCIETERIAELEEVDVSSTRGDDWQEEVRRMASAAESPLDFVRGPLFRFILYRRSPTDHVFLYSFNHIITDGWSTQVFLRDLGAAYSAAVSGGEPDWPALEIQYADFAAWQRRYLTPEVEAAHLKYWRGHLVGAPPALEMVTDLPRPAVAGDLVADARHQISGELVRDLKELARSEDATLFVALVAIYFRVLNLYTGRSDLVIGIPSAGRGVGGLDDLLGFFINSLPLRIRVEGDLTFRQLLGLVKRVAREALDHQDLPFDRLVEELQPERDLSRTPVFQTMLVFQNYRRLPARFIGLDCEPFELGAPAARPGDFAFVFRPAGDSWGLQLVYRTDLFEATTATRLVKRFAHLLESVVRKPDVPLSSIPPADEEEKRLAIEEWSGITTEYPRDACVHTLFERQVEECPQDLAIVMGQDRMTYREVNERANRLAHYLIGLGVGPEVVVGLLGERAIDSIVAIMAVFKAGGAYLPIDPEAPPSRIEFLVANAGAPVMLVHGPDQVALAPEGVTAIDLTDVDAGAQSGNPGVDVSAKNLAYVLYTSGSTGDPKGVEVEHRQIIREVRGCDYFEYPPDRVFSNLAPLWFDVSCIEILGALLNGASCAIYPERLPTAVGLRDFFAEHSVTTIHIVASLLNVLLDEFPESLRGIKEIFTGGEALDPAHIDTAVKTLPDARIFNVYGPTECATIATYYEIPRGDWACRRAVPIGRPVANTTVYILDDQGEICPPGVPGELYIGGEGVARGYLGDPTLTARRFVADPFSVHPGARLYRSGDRCRYLEDGVVDFLGRLDDQVKVRGFRIEPGEVSVALNRCDGVRESVVVAREKPSGANSLVAYVVAEHDPVPAIDDLKRRMAQLLPAYMMPEAFVLLEELPLTSNGKVDVRSLPDPPKITTDGSSAAPPRDATELQLTAIWARVLGVTGVGVDDDFFALGGNSLLALTLFSEIENALGESLPLATLFQAPTVRQLVELWKKSGPRKEWSCVVPIQPRGSRPPFFCVHGLNGNVISLRALAERMGRDRPFYAIQAVGLDGRTPPLRSVEAMARRYAAEIRTVRPEGPYIVGGLCFGGMVAFATARMLMDGGDSVPLVVMIDSPIPLEKSERKARKPKRDLLRSILELLRRARLMTARDSMGWVHVTHKRARDRYVPIPYGGKVLSFTSTHFGPENTFTLERRDRWDRVIEGEHECRVIDGHHSLILSEPTVGFIADTVNQRVDECMPG